MSVGLILERTKGAPITLAEWTQLLASDPNLRVRTEPYEATNPKTGQVIRMPAGEADAELHVGDQWLPLLSYRRGRLTTRFLRAYEDQRNPVRQKIAAVAKQLKVVITTDAGDDLLNW